MISSHGKLGLLLALTLLVFLWGTPVSAQHTSPLLPPDLQKLGEGFRESARQSRQSIERTFQMRVQMYENQLQRKHERKLLQQSLQPCRPTRYDYKMANQIASSEGIEIGDALYRIMSARGC